MRVTYEQETVCWREYEPFTVLYDLKGRQVLTLQAVAADIWHHIARSGSCEFEDIVDYVASEYGCGDADVAEDVADFIGELHDSGIVQLEGASRERPIQAVNASRTDEDIEGDVIRELEAYDQIYSATFEMTYACNESCVHCYAHYPGSTQAHMQVTSEAYRSAIDELRDMGCMHLAFTGGDPFVSAVFPELFFYARECGFVCDVYTNGLFLYNNDELLVRMAAARPRAFFVSIYGSKPEIHDAVTRTSGSFEKTVHVVRRLRELDVPVVLNVMLLSINHSDLPGIIDLANDLGVEYRASMSLIRRNDGSDEPLDYFVGDREAIKRAILTIRDNFYSIDVPASELVRTEYMCGAGVTSISVDPSGQIHPCISLKNVLGNIVEGTIWQAWNGAERQKVMGMLRWDNTKECMDCASQRCCPHCPGMSQAESGDAFACNSCDKIVSECIMEIDA